jgi:hypothetical protein
MGKATPTGDAESMRRFLSRWFSGGEMMQIEEVAEEIRKWKRSSLGANHLWDAVGKLGWKNVLARRLIAAGKLGGEAV